MQASSALCAVCSQCIRRHGDSQLRLKGARLCPECRTPWESAHLVSKPVRALEVACRAFAAARGGLLAAVQADATHTDAAAVPSKRQRDSTKAAEQADVHRCAQQGKASSRAASAEPAPSRDDSQHVSRESTLPSAAAQAAAAAPAAAAGGKSGVASAPAAVQAVPKPPPGCEFCPICGRVFSTTMLQRHVDSCLISADTGQGDSRSAPVASGRSASTSSKAVLDLTASPRAPCTLLVERIPMV